MERIMDEDHRYNLWNAFRNKRNALFFKSINMRIIIKQSDVLLEKVLTHQKNIFINR
jgi:fibrillarin-like rRNA methylase